MQKLNLELIRGLAEFRRTVRAFLVASEGLAKTAGVTAVQYQGLLAICAFDGPMPIRDLADQLMLTHSAAVQAVDRLARAGLVQRGTASHDRRIVLVKLTPEGGRLLASLAQRHLEELLRQERALRASLRRIKVFARGHGGQPGAQDRD